MTSILTANRPETQNNQDILEVMPILVVDVYDKLSNDKTHK